MSRVVSIRAFGFPLPAALGRAAFLGWAASPAQGAEDAPILRGHRASVTSVAFSPDGRLALSGAADRTLKLWVVATGREPRGYLGHRGPVFGVALSPDGMLARSGSGDNSARLWRLFPELEQAR